MRQLNKRFGHLPDWVTEKLDAADEKQLQHWVEQILDAKSIEEVFK